MSNIDEKENQILNKQYPPGTQEREILDYSRGEHLEEELPKMLVMVFKLLMGISFVMAVVIMFGYLFNHS